MTRQVRWLMLLPVVVYGCATAPLPPVPVPTLPVVEEAIAEAVSPAAPIPAEARQLLMASEPLWVEGPPLQVTAKAVKLATVKPALAGFDRGMLVYPFRAYGIYWAGVPEHGGLHIQLQPGEVIRLVGGLREKVWLVQRDDATTVLERSHLIITALEPEAHGRLALVTSLGVYYLDLHGQAHEGLYAISWQHPGRQP